MNPVIKGAGYVLIHTPDMIIHNGTTQTVEKQANPDSEYLKAVPEHIRSFEKVVSYPPNQTYIGGMTPKELKEIPMPWYDKEVSGATRFAKFGEIMPEDEFIGLIKIVDAFDLVKLEKNFSEIAKASLKKHPLFSEDSEKLPEGESFETIQAMLADGGEGLYYDKALVGCVKKAHDVDHNLTAHIMLENLVVKASGAVALKNLLAKNNISASDVDYVIECSEEACGDMNQRGGGNFAKAIAEVAGLMNATGSDTRGFCAAPTHALIQAASLVKAGTYKNVVLMAGGATAKLGMNGKDHVKKGLPILEDVLGGFAVLISEDDGVSPVLNTDIVGRHTVGTGSAPQAVITALVANPLSQNDLRITDVDVYSVEMQNPDITKPAGAGDVPESNYKMIAALGVMRKEIEKADIGKFITEHGMVGWAPTQGHIPSGVPYLGFAREDLTTGSLNRAMIVGKGSLFLGRMTNLFDGVSIVVERNHGKAEPQVSAVQVGSVKRVKIGLTLLGSELGVENLVKGAEIAFGNDGNFDIVLIGPKVDTKLELVEVADETAMYKKMEELLDSKAIDGCVTMHYNFPIGVSTVGKMVTPGLGKEMFLATTTGTSSTNRVESMIRNTIHGIVAAKAAGIQNPTVGILNVDGARQVERALTELNESGYPIHFSASVRADGGAVMRGNDLLCGSVDVMVTDSLTGNIMMKVFSSFTTGGSYESSGYGYGPGIGEGYNRLVLILSRASGVPVVANALSYAAKLAKGNVSKVSRVEFEAAKKAGLLEIIAKQNKSTAAPAGESKAQIVKPAKEVVDEEVTGIDILELEDAVDALSCAGIYAESGMGCTGPVVMVNAQRAEKVIEILKEKGFLS